LAVDRNKIKRWVREVFSKRSSKMGYVVVVKKGFLQKGFKFIYSTFNSALDGVENNKPSD
jgi:ribonuclease P protein component